jgi:hypothetical protein
MKSSLKILFLTLPLAALVRPAAAQLNLPEPSPSAEVKQKVGFTDVTVVYARPGVKGRVIFGGLVPYGKLWRTGASDATIVTFSDSVKVQGSWLPKGSYSLFTIPEKDTWTVIFNKHVSGHGTEGYEERNDALRFRVKADTAVAFQESFTISVNELLRNTARMSLGWARTAVSFRLESNANDRVVAEIKRRIEVEKEEKPGLYYQAALYYFDTEQDAKQALAWASKAVALKPAFNYYHLQAKLFARLRDYPSAIAAARKSADLAGQEKFADYVTLNNRMIAEWQQAK